MVYMRIQSYLPGRRSAVRAAAAALSLPAAEAEVLVRHARVRTWNDEDRLAVMGGLGAAVHVILDGEASVRTAAGMQPQVGAGSVIGEMYAGNVRWYQLADVVCVGPVRTLTVPVSAWRIVEAQCPTLAAIVAAQRTPRIAALEAAIYEERAQRWDQYQTAMAALRGHAAR